MARTVQKERRRIHWGALTILLAGAIAFGLGLWARVSLHPGPTALENLIADNAPAENVQALTTWQSQYLVGTSLGILRGSGRQWTRLPGVPNGVRSIVALPDGTLLVAARGTGVSRYENGSLTTLLPGDADAVAVTDAGRVFAVLQNRLIQVSTDSGRTWMQAGEAAEPVIALAAGEAGVAIGGLQGSISFSPDGGQRWEMRPAPGGSVTALLFDPSKSGRLWTCAGGAVLYSDDTGMTWHRPARKAADRPLVALAPAPAGEQGIRAISADGLLVTLGD